MGESMIEARFLALAEAYGGDIARWPEAERAAAAVLAQARPELAAALAAEGELDAVLDRDAIEVSVSLRDRVIAVAPRARAAARVQRWLATAGLGLGLAASCAAGVACGFTLAPHSVVRLVSGHAAPAPDDLSSLADPFGDGSVS